VRVKYVDKYLPQANLDYEGNPFIAALPKIPSKDEWTQILEHTPAVAPHELELPAEERAQCIFRLRRLFVARGIHRNIAERLDALLRQSYVGLAVPRDIAERVQSGQPVAERRLEAVEFGTAWEGTPEGIAIFGVSGMGKTELNKQVVEYYPEVIIHPLLGVVQIPILRVETPHNGSTAQFLKDIIREIDRLVGENFTAECRRFTEDDLQAKVVELCNRFFVGMIFVDELQVLSLKKSGGREEVLNFFLRFFNLLKRGLVLIATPAGAEIFQDTFREMRRAGSFGTFVWDRWACDERFMELLRMLWRYQWTTKVAELGDREAKAMYHCSAGITSLVVRLFALAQLRAIQLDKPISAKLIMAVYKEAFPLLEPMLRDVRSGSPRRIARHRDFRIPSIVDLASRLGVVPRGDFVDVESADAADAAANATIGAALQVLRDMQYSVPDALAALKARCRERPQDDVRELVRHVMTVLDSKGAPSAGPGDDREASAGGRGEPKAQSDAAISERDVPGSYEELKVQGRVVDVAEALGVA
jgi:hypothetical protein